MHFWDWWEDYIEILQYPDERGLFTVDKRQLLHCGQFFVASLWGQTPLYPGPSPSEPTAFIKNISLGTLTQWQRRSKCD